MFFFHFFFFFINVLSEHMTVVYVRLGLSNAMPRQELSNCNLYVRIKICFSFELEIKYVKVHQRLKSLYGRSLKQISGRRKIV